MGTMVTSIQVRAYTLMQLSAIYGVSKHVMRNWLKPFTIAVGQRRGRYYTAAQVATIFSLLGVPGFATE